MTDQEPEEVRVFWVPEIAENPLDLSNQEPLIPLTEPVTFSGEAADYINMDEIRAIDAIPEGTLTDVVLMDDEGAGVVGHAEVIHNEDGSRTLKVYGLNHNPEEQP